MLRRLIFFLFAILISGGTAIMAQRWLHSRVAASQQAAPPVIPKTLVLVAKTDLATGSFLRADSLRWQEWPKENLADSYIVEGKAKPEDFAGAVVRSRLTAGEPVTQARVVHPGDRGFLAAVLKPGDRAVTVNVTPSSGMAGFIYPGDRVDLILTTAIHSNDKDAQTQHMSETVLTDLRVVGMDQRLTDEKDKKETPIPKTATLEVTPKQAEIVSVISELGLISLSLRSLATGDEDTAPQDATGPRISRTLDSEAVHYPRPETPASTIRKIDVMRGSESSEVIVQTPGSAAAPQGTPPASMQGLGQGLAQR
jgi:pilus assembly protein CpaB